MHKVKARLSVRTNAGSRHRPGAIRSCLSVVPHDVVLPILVRPGWEANACGLHARRGCDVRHLYREQAAFELSVCLRQDLEGGCGLGDREGGGADEGIPSIHHGIHMDKVFPCCSMIADINGSSPLSILRACGLVPPDVILTALDRPGSKANIPCRGKRSNAPTRSQSHRHLIRAWLSDDLDVECRRERQLVVRIGSRKRYRLALNAP